MRRCGIITRVSKTHVTVSLRPDGLLRVKKSALHPLVCALGLELTIEFNVAVAPSQSQEPDKAESQRRAKWVIREYIRQKSLGRRPNLTSLLRRAHLQLVE